MSEASRIRFKCGHKARIDGVVEAAFGKRTVVCEYLGTGTYEARVMDDGVVLCWKQGHEPRVLPRVIAGPPFKKGDVV